MLTTVDMPYTKVMSRKAVIFTISFMISTLGCSICSFSRILPEEVLIIANAEIPDSIKIARYYAKTRNIPAGNILAIKAPQRELISAEEYQTLIRVPIRKFIKNQHIEDKIKLMVLIYGIPLKIRDRKPLPNLKGLTDNIKEEYKKTYLKISHTIEKLRALLNLKAPLSNPSEDTATYEKKEEKIDYFRETFYRITNELNSLYKVATHKINTLDGTLRYEFLQSFLKLKETLEGLEGLLPILPKDSPEAQKLKQQTNLLTEIYWKEVMKRPKERNFPFSWQVSERLGGNILKLKTLYEDYIRVNYRDSRASVDSELSLILYDWYPLAGRILNALNPRFKNHPAAMAFKKRTIMVARIDGPSADIAARIIEDSIRAEKEGLKGRLYIDARGINSPNNLYEHGLFEYDQDLRDLSKLVKEKTRLPVILDNTPSLFGPDSCKDVALYCGWYNLRHYIPAFTFNYGAVGFHIASFEAETLKGASDRWCKKMLEEGAAATLGPVDEPYLDAFPLPSEFFSLLLTGKYTIVEVFYMTKRYNSWQMVLVADPLYNPYRSDPLLDEKQIELKPLKFMLYKY